MTPTIEFKTVQKELPIFSTNISQFQEPLKLAMEAILEEKNKNPVPMDSNVKAHYVSDYSSHLFNPKFNPLIDIVLSFCEEISKTYYKNPLKYKCFNCWGMIYGPEDHAVKHNHFPSTFGVVVYIDVDNISAPIIFEDQLSVVPVKGSLIVFPAILNHEVPKTSSKRIAVAMNIDHIS